MRRLLRAVVLLLLVGACGAASAHSPIAGIGHFYNGMLHPLFVPAHLMSIIAMGLWLGQAWPAQRNALLALVLAVPLGMAAGIATGWQKAEVVILGLTAAIAVAAAAARPVPLVARMVAGAALGLLLGLDSLPEAANGRAFWLSLAGTWLAVLLGLSWVVFLSELAARPWMKIAQRAVASWVAAAALLVIALSWLGPKVQVPSASVPVGAGRPSR